MAAEFCDRVRIEYVRVPMRDGVEICAKVTRPDDAGCFPAIMEYNPYRRLRQPLPNYRDEYPPAVPYLVERGYVAVQFDARGTGNSSGWNTDIYNLEEQQDACEMVRWIAAQPWCSGQVGMIGKSFSAVVQWQVAVQAPSALKAIIVRSANDDVYTEWVYPGGCLRPYMFDSYSGNMNAWNFAPPDPDVVGDRWYEIWQERLQQSAPWGIGYLSHPLQGPYWQQRSLSADYNRVQCAVFVVSGWSDCYPTALLRAFEHLQCPKKALVGPWGHWYGEEAVAVPGPRIDTRPLYQRWFDYWLKGIDNGVMEEPPVTLFVRRYSRPEARMPLEEPGDWRHENEWPIERTQPRTLYLTAAGLSEQPAGESGGDDLCYRPGSGIASGIHWGGGVLPWGMPLDQRLDAPQSLVYTSDPLPEELEITGTPRARLYVSSTATVAYFRVKLIDVAPDGTAKLVRYGGLNATHRNSHETPAPLPPGEVVPLDIPLKAVSYVFAAGHRLQIAIAGADFQNAWPTPQPATHTVHRGAGHTSQIILPVVPAQDTPLAAPQLCPLPPADPQGLNVPDAYSITQDLAARTTTARLEVTTGDTANQLQLKSRFTVNDDRPADATLQATAHYHLQRDALDIEVHSEESTSSDQEAFHHQVHVRILRDGQPCFEKDWSISVPRTLN